MGGQPQYQSQNLQVEKYRLDNKLSQAKNYNANLANAVNYQGITPQGSSANMSSNNPYAPQ